MTQRDKNFIELYFEAVDENIDEVIEELKDSGIDPEESEQLILQMIKKQKAELKLERGMRLKSRIEEIIKKKIDLPVPADNNERLALAARKLEELSDDDILIIKKDAALLDEIEKIIRSDKDEAGRTRGKNN